MASMSPISITKQPLKYIEIPLRKFSEEVIPHHQQIYEQHRTVVHKLISVNNSNQITREIQEKKRVIKQLKDLMYELDTLRTQVEDTDLDKFDSKTLSLRKIILNLISGYTNLEKVSDEVMRARNTDMHGDEDKANRINPFSGASDIQIQANLQDLKLQEHQTRLNRVENIHRDVEDLHEMYHNLNDMVQEQGEHVENIEENVENAQENVKRGVKDIVRAHKLQAVAYPATGALLGGIIGGPIGLLAGLKVGGIAAIGCALAGYTGGIFFKKIHDPDVIQVDEGVQHESVVEIEGETQKKDI